LRWINAGAMDSVNEFSMVLYRSQPDSPAQPAQAEAVHLPAVAERHDLVSVAVPIPAAWPAGASQLAIAIDAVQRSKDVEVHCDWVAAARN
jgi:hypothetical protein